MVLLQEKPVAPSESKDLATPTSTPTQSRKNRRRSNIFTVSSLQSFLLVLTDLF